MLSASPPMRPEPGVKPVSYSGSPGDPGVPVLPAVDPCILEDVKLPNHAELGGLSYHSQSPGAFCGAVSGYFHSRLQRSACPLLGLSIAWISRGRNLERWLPFGVGAPARYPCGSEVSSPVLSGVGSGSPTTARECSHGFPYVGGAAWCLP